MIGKIVDIIWVLMNIYLIISYGQQVYQYFLSGDIGKAVICLCSGVAFVLLTILIFYRNVRDTINKKKYFKNKANSNPWADEDIDE